VVDEWADAAVIARSLDDPPAFAAVYDRHASVLFRFLVRRVGRDTADELLGDVFRIAFEQRTSYDVERSSARPWLYGIANNLLARHRRTEARRLRATAHLAARAVPRGNESDGVDAAVDARGLWPRVTDAIAGLPDGERDALMLYAWEELSYDDIAVALGIPVGTVRSRINRARRRLRELTEPSGEQPAGTGTP
jgi:RNA polymerase sigma-70 factor (ECF subfamily)